MTNVTKRNWNERSVLILVGLMLGVLPVSSTGFAQKVNEPVTRILGDRGVKIIDRRPLPVPVDQDIFGPEAAAALDPPPAPLEDTFTLHSSPSSTKVIYLDFDGHTAGSFVYPPWNYEGPDTTFSDTERTIIQHSWLSISEDFLPFDVDVTTEFPGIEALKNSGGSDTEWGVRAVINHSSYDYSWAYVGTFSDSADTELYAWSGDGSGAGSPEDETWIWIADSVSHEAGHTLGLSHDGVPGQEYYTGHGTGDTAWSPIMGWTNYGLSQWDKGEFNRAKNEEDDLDIITTQNGFGYRPDDHGSTAATATAVNIHSSLVEEGIIETSSDIDYFGFTMGSDGNIDLAINGDYLAPNLDISARIHDTDDMVLFTSNPPTGVDAAFDVFLPAGDYYLSIDGTGYDDPTSDGYSDYGSLGYYSIAVPEPSALTALGSGVAMLALLYRRRRDSVEPAGEV